MSKVWSTLSKASPFLPCILHFEETRFEFQN